MIRSILAIHIAAGLAAILIGVFALAARKGDRIHTGAGTGFVIAMLILGVTASILEPYRTPPGSPISGVLVCYFVLTGWMTSRRRDGGSGWFEILASVAAIGTGVLIFWGGTQGSTTPAGQGPVFILAALCLYAGLLDLSVVLRKTLSAGQRIRRHVWRICFAFFIATGSFFIGQQQVMPAVIRGSPILFVLGFAPFAVMVFWLIRLRFGKFVHRLQFRAPRAMRPELGAAK